MKYGLPRFHVAKDLVRVHLRTLSFWASLFGGAMFALFYLWTDRRAGTPDDPFLSSYGTLVVPLVLVGCFTAILGKHSASVRALPYRLLGASESEIALGEALFVTAVCAFMGLLLVELGTFNTGGNEPRLALGWIGALWGASFGAYLSLARRFPFRGAQWLLAFADYFVGTTHGALSLFFPRAHFRSLLGGSPPLGLDQRLSSLSLVILFFVYLAMGLARSPRNSAVKPPVPNS